MSVPSPSAKGLPDSYRIALALSIAFLLHTLFLSGLPFPQPDAPEKQHRLMLELLTSGSTPATSSQPTTPAVTRPREQPGERNPRFEIPESAETTSPAPAPVTSTLSPRTVPEPSQRNNPTAPDNTRQEPAEQQATPSKPASVDSQAGKPKGIKEEAENTELARITRSPSQQDPYLIRLAVHLAKELERLRLPAITRLTDSARMEIELQLMKNGALTRARVVKSTGIQTVDEAAYRAALAASPYPEPPADSGTGDRFGVELVFSPKRL
ncbi:TonB family protein [Marinobacter sp. DUT-1]|uniref:TonB family protein n=1 Tax=Marinobacter sp. DUT-1 TaxID=3412037 RepID=UPI003D186E41